MLLADVDDATVERRLKAIAESTVRADGAVLEVANSVGFGSGADDLSPGRPRTGLTIVSAVLDAHGGSIDWDRAEGHLVARATLPGDLSRPGDGRRYAGLASSPSDGSSRAAKGATTWASPRGAVGRYGNGLPQNVVT